MWFLGLVLGALLGGAIGDDEGAVIGAIAGAVLGWQWQHRGRSPAETSRLDALEDRVRDLTATVDLLRSRIRLLEEQGVAPVSPGQEALPDALPAPIGEDAASATPAVDRETAAPAASAAVAVSSTAPIATPARDEPQPAPGDETDASPPLSTAWGSSPVAPPAWIRRTIAWFSGGNAVVRVGIVILFIGVAFLLKYAYDHARLPPELRVAGAMLGGVALLALGWRLRQSRPAFALPLQGGGVGILYLAVFAAFRLYALVPAGIAFAVLAVLAVGTVILALVQNVQSLAVLAVSGGFLAPILVSTGTGNHVALFSYYALLNAGILAIASRRAWRPLNLTGFAFTFVIGAMWGASAYRPDLFTSTQPFLALFFLVYLAIPALFARQTGSRTDSYLDGTLVFGLPIVALALESRVVAEFEYGLAIACLLASACYVVAARLVRQRHGDTQPLLVLSFASIAFVLATLAIPLALDARWSSAAWALEGSAVVWVGLQQRRWLPRVAGYVLQLGAGVLFLDGLGDYPRDLPILNRDALGFALLAVAAWFTAFSLERRESDAFHGERVVRYLALGLGGLWWVSGVVWEAERFVPDAAGSATLAAAFAATCAVFELLRRRLDWRDARLAAQALAPLLLLPLVVALALDHHPFGHGGVLAWPAAAAVWLWILRRHDGDDVPTPSLLPAIALWIGVSVLAAEGRWVGLEAFPSGSSWPLAAMLAAAALVLGFTVRGASRSRWPVIPHTDGFLDLGGGLLSAALLAFVVAANFASDGAAPPLPYVPGLNPFDLATFAALLSLEFWLRSVEDRPLGQRLHASAAVRYGPIGTAAFLVANAVLLRTLHHYAGAPLDPDSVLHSRVDQAGLSIFWTAIALLLMVLAHRRTLRALWMVGAGLLGLTVLKLIAVDLRGAGSLETIVSFVGVGVLMLVVGYFAPVPPKREEPSS